MTAELGFALINRPIKQRNKEALVEAVVLGLATRRTSVRERLDPDWLTSIRANLSDLTEFGDVTPTRFAGYVRGFHLLTEKDRPVPVMLQSFPGAMGKLATHPNVQLELMRRNFEGPTEGWQPISVAEKLTLERWVDQLSWIDPTVIDLVQAPAVIPSVDQLYNETIHEQPLAVAS